VLLLARIPSTAVSATGKLHVDRTLAWADESNASRKLRGSRAPKNTRSQASVYFDSVCASGLLKMS
jgi:hypothetical protein